MTLMGQPVGLGQEVIWNGRRYLVTTIMCDGRIILTHVPEGLSPRDLGRRFLPAECLFADEDPSEPIEDEDEDDQDAEPHEPSIN